MDRRHLASDVRSAVISCFVVTGMALAVFGLVIFAMGRDSSTYHPDTTPIAPPAQSASETICTIPVCEQDA